MLKKMIVTTDGVNFIGRLKGSAPSYWKTRGGRTIKSRKFDKYYYEAQYQNVPDKDIPNYIQMRFMEDADDIINDSIDDVEYMDLWKNFQNRLHKRLVRYRQKLLMLNCNYFVTFTYDDKKESAEGFEKRLLIAFNNLAKRNQWKVVGGWENGELEGRTHFHAFIHVPEGQMIGELELRKRYSYKRHKMEYYLDNTYFAERFGMSDWIKVDRSDIVSGGLADYLVKYVVKSGRKLFYSRGIKNELELDIDTDDVLLSYYNHGFKHILNPTAFMDRLKAEDREKYSFLGFEQFELNYNSCFEFDVDFSGFTESFEKCPIVR